MIPRACIAPVFLISKLGSRANSTTARIFYDDDTPHLELPNFQTLCGEAAETARIKVTTAGLYP
ncbi:hypothetical protein J6590_059235, partial [Homalodisca vitripennis]